MLLQLFFFFPPFSIRVSNELGAGRPQAAQLAIYVVLFMVTIEGILVATALILGRNFWAYSYSNEASVVTYVGEMMLLLAISHFFYGIQSVLSGLCQSAVCSYLSIRLFITIKVFMHICLC